MKPVVRSSISMLNVAYESMPMEWSCAAHLQQICDAPESPTANETANTGAVDAAQAAVPRRRGRQQESQLKHPGETAQAWSTSLSEGAQQRGHTLACFP